MKANELRLGNWITANTPPMIVMDIDETGVELYMPGSEADNFHEDIDNCEGIPLTPAILEKCGFERVCDSNIFKLPIKYTDTEYPCTLQVTGDGIQICRSEIGAITAPVKYIHQLQNLYFALTGGELIVNL